MATTNTKEEVKKSTSAKVTADKKGGKTLTGVVVSDKMQDTVVVAVTRFVKHPKYRKFMKSVKKYHVHNPGNIKKEGDKVTIRECRPMSKTKNFIVVEA
jgi:small subunit ribosomal protein S17